MAALGWLLNLDYAASESAYVPPVVVPDPDQGKGSGGSRKKRRGLYDDVEIPKVGFFDQPKIGESSKSKPEAKALSGKQAKTDKSKSDEKPYMTAMAEAFEKVGIATPDQFIREQEAIDKRKKINLAAILLLLD